MQGIKDYQEKLFLNFRLSEYVPKENFYRHLKDTLDLSYLRGLTKKYYGSEGQKSIDTEVFFKLMLIGYLENINSDRQIVESAKMRMDMLYFLGYDLDESLPWHSTLSRTRKLFGKDIFWELFRNILRLCVEKGMVCGKTQAVDSAFIKANASMDSLVERELTEKSKRFLTELTANEDENVNRKLKHNERFVSPTDPDSRVSKKPNKPRSLDHLGIISVDTENHVICGALVDFADKKDSDTTKKIVGQTVENLLETGLSVDEVLADAGYSSGASYSFLEENNITAYIPVHGGYKPEKTGFMYNENEDFYTCTQGVKLPFKSIKKEKNRKTQTKEYRAMKTDCKYCLLKKQCCKNSNYGQVSHSIDKPYYDKAYTLLNTRKGRQKMRLRKSTVEPVWGTLLHFRGMKKVYTKGNALATKQLLMAAAAYNLKKLLGFNCVKIAVMTIRNIVDKPISTWRTQFLLF
ncbi:MAG: IS1182 family transposase [Bacteroidales bacterium]|nr:IS1182 family transposase [Bacteroidales bacterium]